MALYLLNPRTFAIEKIVSTQARGTISMSVSPHNDNLVACSGVDGSLCIWDLANESCERRLTHPADILAWDPHDPSNCAIIVNSPKIQLFSWCVYWLTQGSTWHVIGIFVRLFAPRNDYLLLIQILSSLMLQGCWLLSSLWFGHRWNPHVVGQLAIGGSNGVVYLYNSHQKKSSSLKVEFFSFNPHTNLRSKIVQPQLLICNGTDCLQFTWLPPIRSSFLCGILKPLPKSMSLKSRALGSLP